MAPPIPGPSSQPLNPDPNSRRFFIPTSTFASPTIPSSRSSFAFDSQSHNNGLGLGSSYSASGSGGSYGVINPNIMRRRSRGQSLAALTSALQTYRVPPESETETEPGNRIENDDVQPEGTIVVDRTEEAGPSTAPHTPPRDQRMFQYGVSADPSLDTAFTPQGISYSGGQAITRSREEREYGIDPEIMDALVEIHRVLYRGREDEDVKGVKRGWREEVNEVGRVVGRWFESDCVYDHPLLRLRSRRSLITHFSLLHLISNGSIPALTPSNAIYQLKDLLVRLRRRTLGYMGLRLKKRSKSSYQHPYEKVGSRDKGKGKAVNQDERLGYDDQEDSSSLESDTDPSKGEIWKLWEVGAECTEIGGMECYDGYHRGLIEHIITLTLLPNLTRPFPNSDITPQISTSPSFVSSEMQPENDLARNLMLSAPTESTPKETKSFGGKLIACLGREFGDLVRWEIPISTIVQFNEVGKVTHVRDTIDVRDFVEAFVPFAKRLNWFTRRISGLVSGAFGGMILGRVLPTSEREARGGKIPVLIESRKVDSTSYTDLRDISPTHLDRDQTSMPMPSERPEINSLGLAGLGLDTDISSVRYLSALRGGAGMAPDRDDAV